jgi:hypothetical protein
MRCCSKGFQTRREARSVVIPRKRRATPYESLLSATPVCACAGAKINGNACLQAGRSGLVQGRIDVSGVNRP